MMDNLSGQMKYGMNKESMDVSVVMPALNAQDTMFSVFSYKNRQPPLFDMCAGNTINRKRCLDLINGLSLADIPKIFYRMTEKDKRFAVLKNDFIVHYSSDTLKKFKKYLFIPYAFSVILPFAESVIKALKYRNAALLIHTPFNHLHCIPDPLLLRPADDQTAASACQIRVKLRLVCNRPGYGAESMQSSMIV